VETLMAHKGTGSIDIFKKSGIVVLLVAAMGLLHIFGVPSSSHHPEGLLALGFLILAGYTIGELAEAVKLPHITGYLLAGLLLGESAAGVISGVIPGLPPPFDEGILTEAVSQQLGFLNELALALIALTAGGELRIASLRKGIRQIFGVLGGQILLLFGVMVAYTYAISGVLPGPMTLDGLVGLDLFSVMALGGVLAAIALATSPAATIAVINGSGAKGPMTDTVLSVVVLKDVVVVVVFSAATAVAVSVVPGAHGGSGLAAALAEIGGAMLLGGLVGLVVHLYLQYADRGIPILLFLVGVIYTTTFVAESLHFHPALVFIAAGFVTANFSPLGGQLIHEVERLSLPVYVVFFALAGAALHLDTLWDVRYLALALVLARGLAVYVGVRLGAVVGDAPDATRKYGWMGFLSQAGLAIVLAGDVKNTYPGEIGEGLFALLVGGVALNEIVGPVLFQWGLSWSGEAGDPPSESDTAEAVDMPQEPPVVESGTEGAWRTPASTSSAEVNARVDELGEELQRLIEDIRRGPVAHLRAEGEDYLGHLRREFLRYHRRATIYVRNPIEGESVAAYLRRELAELGEAWRERVLDRMASRNRKSSWDPMEIVDALDELVSTLPESRQAEVEPGSLVPRDEGVLMRLRRRLLTARVGLRPVAREITLRGVGRYHLSGLGPSSVEPVVALLVDADAHLAERTSALFASVTDAWQRLAALAEDGASPEVILLALRTVRSDIREDFGFAVDELARVEEDAVRRSDAAFLGHLFADIQADVLTVGTMDLPQWKRRYGRVYRDRNVGLTVLTEGLSGARKTVAARYAALALELELIGFEGRVGDAAEVFGEGLARAIRGRGSTQLQRVAASLDLALDGFEKAVGNEEATSDWLAEELLTIHEPLTHRISEGVEAVRELRVQLEGESAVGSLIQSLLSAADGLTEWCTVPTEKADHGEWRLPLEVPTMEVPFRKIAVGFIETTIAQGLVDAARVISGRIDELDGVLRELQRVVAFNVDLAGSELEELGNDEPMPSAAREVVHEMVVGAIGRSRGRLQRLIDPASGWGTLAHGEIRDVLDRELRTFRGQILDGGGADLTRLFSRNDRVARRLALRAEAWKGWLPDSAEQLVAGVVRALGEDRVEGVRQGLGLPAELSSEKPLQTLLAAPRVPRELPVVYRRLFSDQALEAGDLLTGRQRQIGRVRASLLGASGSMRNAALVGVHDAGVRAVANAALRGVPTARIRQFALSRPATVADVEAWFTGEMRDQIAVLSGLKWLFVMRPGGAAPLQLFIERVMNDSGSNAWLVIGERSVWTYASRVAPLAYAFDTPVSVGALDVEDLSGALLARHAMSGYELDIEAGDDLSWQVQNFLLRGSDREARQRDAWFHTLHEASAGVMHDALRLWIASIQSVDDSTGTIRIGPVERPPLARLGALSDEVHLTLLQVTRQGWMTVELFSTLFGVERSFARAHLGSLTHLGVLVNRGEHYDLATHLRTPILRVLENRGWSA
jgi:Kef-type K+ transport system membrane component KefB